MIRHFTATGIVLHEGSVLLIEHAKLGWWMPPGRHLDPDEDPVQAVLREVREETGLDCEIIAPQPFAHDAVRVLPAPFTILVEDVPEHGQTRPAHRLHLHPAARRRPHRADRPGRRSHRLALGTHRSGPRPAHPTGTTRTHPCCRRQHHHTQRRTLAATTCKAAAFGSVSWAKEIAHSVNSLLMGCRLDLVFRTKGHLAIDISKDAADRRRRCEPATGISSR